MLKLWISSGRVRLFCTATEIIPKTTSEQAKRHEFIEILGNSYKRDDFTNVTKHVCRLTERKLHRTRHNPINLISLRIRDYFHQNYKNRFSSPLYSFIDNLDPVVTPYQNFDSILVPKDHISRKKGDTYYINSEHMLRAHTSAHQQDLIRSGLDHFLCVGDVYRRDEIDRTHFPCFHQMEGLSLFTDQDLFITCERSKIVQLFERGERNREKQECHTFDCAQILQQHLKFVLEGLAKFLFGQDLECRWIDAYFPFTHPSFELEILHNGSWVEVLGCGIIEQKLLTDSGIDYKVGWAFGLGLERLAMKLYGIPDIRMFWSTSPEFISQFETDDHHKQIVYQPVSRFPKIVNDMAMWLPNESKTEEPFDVSNFYEIVRSLGGDLVEKVELFDDFFHSKTQRRSHCYRITYRHMERPIRQSEISLLHNKIGDEAAASLGVEIRR